MRSSSGKSYLLCGNIQANDLSTMSIGVVKENSARQFASRATHSSPPAFIVATLDTTLDTTPGTDQAPLKLSKTFAKPDCPIVYSDDAAYRLSYLWAHQEIERLVAAGDTQQAVELASVYREVSPVSGAVVLERESDYTYNSLDRNQYRTTSYDRATANATDGFQSRGGLRSVAPKAALEAAAARTSALTSTSTSAAVSVAAPTSASTPASAPASAPAPAAKKSQQALTHSHATRLSGATNGTIGPSSEDGSADATVIQGVNTSRPAWPVGNLANVAGMILAITFDALLLIAAAILAISGLKSRRTDSI
jgi:hypothetical protein